MFSSSCLFLGRLIYNQKRKAFHLRTPAKGRKLLHADSPETKILKTGRGKPYVAVRLSKQLKILVKEMFAFITKKVNLLA